MDPLYIQVNPRDNVAIVVNPEGLRAGSVFSDGLTLTESIPQAHKVALRDLGAGQRIVRYGEVIGFAARDIPGGSWVREDLVTLPAAPALDELPLATAVPAPLEPLDGSTFEGYRNPDGSTGTKNIL